MHCRSRIALAALLLLGLATTGYAGGLKEQLLLAQTEADVDALLAAQPGDLNTELGKAVLAESNRLRDQSEYTKALLLAQIAEKIARQVGDKTGTADAMNRESALYDNLAKPDPAMQYAQQALKLSQELNYGRGTADALVLLGAFLKSQGKTAEAKDSYQKSLSLYEELQDKPGMASCFNNLGIISATGGKYEEAREYYGKALVLRQETGDQRRVAGSLNNIAVTYRSQANYAQALEYYNRSLEASAAAGDQKITAITTFNIGNIYKARGDLRTALEYNRKALKMFEALGIEDGRSFMLFGLGTTYRALGNYEEALRYHLLGLKLGEKSGDKREISDAYCHIGAVYSEQGNYSLAASYTNKCMEVRQSADLKEHIPDTYGDLGKIYLRQGAEDVALKYFQEGLVMAQDLKLQDDVAALSNLRGYANFLAGNFRQASEDYTSALAASRSLKDQPNAASTLEHLGYLRLAEGNGPEALKAFEESLGISLEMDTKKLTADVQRGIAEVYSAQADYANAVDFSRRSAELAGAIHSPETLWQALTTLGKAQRALARPDEARQSLEQAIAVIDGLRLQVSGSEEERQRFFEDKLAPYDSLVSLLCEQKKFDEALVYAERGKARVLDDLLQQGKIEIAKAITPTEQEQEQDWIAKMISLNTQIRTESARKKPDEALLSGLNKQVDKTRADYEVFRAGLYDAHPQLKVQPAVAEPLKVENFPALLHPRDVVLEYVVSDDRTLVFVMDRKQDGATDLHVYPIEIRRMELAKQIEAFRVSLSNRDPGFLSHAESLYRILLLPAESALKGHTGIVIIPDRDLWGLPFQALIDGKGESLMNRFAASYAPSLTVLRDLQRMRPQAQDSAQKLLAFGNPFIASSISERVKAEYRDQELLPLPEAEMEAKVLQKLYGKASAAVFTGEAASEGRWKQESGKYNVLHLATHGILNSSSPLYSHLVLAHPASETGEDGLLEAWEIMQSNLSADLVVLSACETALGRIGAGEGMIGLSWAFFAAGARATVVSQWKVESESTAELMLAFHRNLRKGIAGNEALRLAAAGLAKNPRYRHPFYWAGFVLIGDASVGAPVEKW